MTAGVGSLPRGVSSALEPSSPGHQAADEVGGDLATALSRALLRLEDEAEGRRDLSRQAERRAREVHRDALEKKRAAARAKMIGGLVGSGASLLASAISTIGGGAGGDASSSGGGAGAEGALAVGKALEAGGEFATSALAHRSSVLGLEGESRLGGAEGLASVAERQGDRADEAERSIERLRRLLERVIDGDHARALAALRG